MIAKTYPILIFNDKIDDSEFTLVDARQEFFFGLEKTVSLMTLSEKELNQDNFKLAINLINDINESMIGAYEDDVIYSNDKKLKCLNALTQAKLKGDIHSSENINKLIELFELSIEKNKNLYFLF